MGSKQNQKRINLWHAKAIELVAFCKKNGTWPDPGNVDPKIRSLGLWKKKLRKYYQQDKLGLELIGYLRGNNFYFDREEGWVKNFVAVKVYAEANGKLPRGNHPLASWVLTQRRNYDNLSRQQKKALENISFKQLLNSNYVARDQKWEQMVERLKTFIKRHGKLPNRAENRTLAMWVGRVRMNLKTGKIPAKKAERLKQNGINLLERSFIKQPWEMVFKRLKQFVKKHGRLPSPVKDSNEKRLYTWLANQRFRFRNGKLELDRARLLEQWVNNVKSASL